VRFAQPLGYHRDLTTDLPGPITALEAISLQSRDPLERGYPPRFDVGGTRTPSAFQVLLIKRGFYATL